MNILILYQFKEHKPLLIELKKSLEKKNIHLGLFNTRTFDYSEDHLTFFLLQFLVRFPKIRTIVYKIYRNKKILNLCKEYDGIDIHFFSTIYDSILPEIKEKRVKISFWGSDAYRINEKRLKALNELTSSVSMIRFNTLEMHHKMKELFSKKDRLGYQIFGNKNFDRLKEIRGSSNESKKKLGLNWNKISLCLGYNSSAGQQHEKMIFELNKLNKECKSKIELILPLTYGANENIKKKIIHQAQKIGIDLKIFKDQLTVSEIMHLRSASDIQLNMQTSDAFSASIQEHFFSGSIMILGKWLPYEWLREKGLYFHSIEIEEIEERLSHVILNFNEEKENFQKNKELIYSISSWNSVIDSWSEDYRKLLA